jgi:ubiquinone/menaquinone biosynthesis C-methylase UbiE
MPGGYFDEVAHEWDHLRESFFTEAVREKALSVAMLRPGRTAADIGAGTGFITEGLIEEGLRVVAIDQSVAMLRVMMRKVHAAKVDRCVGSAEHLPFRNGVFYYVFANMCLHHVERPQEAIREMSRILLDGGKLVITDLDAHDFAFLKHEHHDRWLGFKREDITEWFLEAGFGNVDVQCVGEQCCAQSVVTDDYASISIFVASGEK